MPSAGRCFRRCSHSAGFFGGALSKARATFSGVSGICAGIAGFVRRPLLALSRLPLTIARSAPLRYAGIDTARPFASLLPAFPVRQSGRRSAAVCPPFLLPSNHLLQRVLRPLVVPPLKLAAIPAQMLAAEVVIYPDVAPFQQRPEGLHPIGVRHGPPIFPHLVLDHFVRPGQSSISAGLVGVNRGRVFSQGLLIVRRDADHPVNHELVAGLVGNEKSSPGTDL